MGGRAETFRYGLHDEVAAERPICIGNVHREHLTGVRCSGRGPQAFKGKCSASWRSRAELEVSCRCGERSDQEAH